ncbi:hypothetical protein VNO77_04458 [Canavalia gladiata]|uniref:Uncharacterized protein n=1 Tax=Canavalia gladiata TaxID=3824 RepID=A0AAN9N1P5_CANGL
MNPSFSAYTLCAPEHSQQKTNLLSSHTWYPLSENPLRATLRASSRAHHLHAATSPMCYNCFFDFLIYLISFETLTDKLAVMVLERLAVVAVGTGRLGSRKRMRTETLSKTAPQSEGPKLKGSLLLSCLVRTWPTEPWMVRKLTWPCGPRGGAAAIDLQ